MLRLRPLQFFQVPTFPKMPLRDPPESSGEVCFALRCWFWCVGGSSESEDQASVKRKSCSPDSQTSTRLFSAAVGVSAHCSWFLPACFVNAGAKWRLRREAGWVRRTGTEPKHFPYLNIYFCETQLDLDMSFKKTFWMTGKVLKVLKYHLISSVCLWPLSSHPEANPVMESLDDTAVILISTSISWLDKNMNIRWRP